MTEEHVVLVDENDDTLGLMDKPEAHKGRGKLHRAISVLLYRIRIDRLSGRHLQEVLLQRRSKNKLLWPLYWTNTVCTHPRDGEPYEDCAARRLKEEMGIVINKKDLKYVFRLNYQAQYNNKLSEYELDSVYIGEWDGDVSVNHNEVDSYLWVEIGRLTQDLHQSFGKYTPWFLTIMEHPHIKTMFKKETIQ